MRLALLDSMPSSSINMPLVRRSWDMATPAPTPDTTPVAINRAQPEKKGSANMSSSNSFLDEDEFIISSLLYKFF
jgi:hypothetical protein